MNSAPPPPPSHDPNQPYVASAGDTPPPDSGGKWKGCLIGCLVVFGFCCLLCAGGGVYVYMNAATWVTTAARSALQALLQDSDLPQEEQTAMLREFDRVADAYKAGEITLEELGRIMEDLAESPVMALVMLKAIETKYLNPSGLSDEEKSDAKRTIVRVVRGVIEEKLTKDDMKRITDHFLLNPDADLNNGQPPQLKQRLSDDELRALLADAHEIVEEREVPADEDYEVKLSEIVREIVDKSVAE